MTDDFYLDGGLPGLVGLAGPSTQDVGDIWEWLNLDMAAQGVPVADEVDPPDPRVTAWFTEKERERL